MAILDQVKTSLRVSGTSFDGELGVLIAAAEADLGVAGVTPVEETDPLIVAAVCTFCKWRFGDPDHAEQFKRAYDEQKAQLSMNTGHTEWPAEV
jgi:hypothetical protein